VGPFAREGEENERFADGDSDSGSISRPPPIPEASEQQEKAKPVEAAREQKITPFDVAGEVDAAGKDLGM
jgi:tryptophanyl-tRNA synthetase